jgi:hypothetical protein
MPSRRRESGHANRLRFILKTMPSTFIVVEALRQVGLLALYLLRRDRVGRGVVATSARRAVVARADIRAERKTVKSTSKISTLGLLARFCRPAHYPRVPGS